MNVMNGNLTLLLIAADFPYIKTELSYCCFSPDKEYNECDANIGGTQTEPVWNVCSVAVQGLKI